MTDTAGVEDLFKRIGSHKGILDISVASADGIPIRCAAPPDCTVRQRSPPVRAHSR